MEKGEQMSQAEIDEAALRVAERSVSDVANALGVTVDAGQIVAYAGVVLDVVRGGTWKRVEGAGAEAAAKITTQAEAESAARSRK